MIIYKSLCTIKTIDLLFTLDKNERSYPFMADTTHAGKVGGNTTKTFQVLACVLMYGYDLRGFSVLSLYKRYDSP